MNKISIALFLVLSCVSAGMTQSTTGSLAGRVVDYEGNPLENVNILVYGKILLGNRGTTTDGSGVFYLSGLPSGQYDVLVDHASFRSRTISKIRIPLGTTVNLGNILLEILSTDNIEVRATADHNNIDLTSTAYAQNLHFDDLDDMPLDRNYQAINKLLPQANESFFGDGISIAGATGLENKYFINGVDVTDPKRGGSATILPYNFVQDIQVLTGGYEAEYRGSLGGLMNVVTYSGGNEFSGKLFGFFTNNRFTGTPRPGATPLPESFAQYDFGASIGGPILRDRLWFFAAYNPMIMIEKVNVAKMGEYDDWRTAHVFAGKLTWKMNGYNTLQLNVFGDPVQGEIVESDLGGATVSYNLVNDELFLYKMKQGSVNATLNGMHVLGNNTLLESRVSWARFRDMLAGDSSSAGIFFKDDVNKFITGSPALGWNDENIQMTLGLKATHLAGDHILKSGIEFASLSYKCDNWVKRLDRSADSIYVGTSQRRYGTTGQYILGLFLQDTWSVTENLKINAGLRWDPQFLEAADGRIVQKYLKNIAPRLGIIYLPGNRDLEKITMSYGRFYQMLSTYVQQWYHLNEISGTWLQWDHDPRVNSGGGNLIWEMEQEIQEEYPEMQGQHYDEITLGYERQIPLSLKLSVRGIYRNLRQGIEDGVDLNIGTAYFGNPGSVPLEGFPRMTREYTALEITLDQISQGPVHLLVAYVLSKTYGNSPGIFNYLWMDDRSNATGQFDTPDIAANGTGLLVNDRTHAFKMLGSYHTDFGLSIGSTFIWMSGTPLSEYGGHWTGYPVSFVSQRGTAGRTPAIWDLSIRAAYELDKVIPGPIHARLLLDVFHLGSPRRAVDYDQTHYFAIDDNGNQINPNPEYLQPIQFQPPTSVRVGMEVDF